MLDGARAGVRGPSAQAEAWRADVVAHQIGNAELRAEIEQLRQRATRAEGERDAANAAMLRGCKEEIAGLVAKQMLAEQRRKEGNGECIRRKKLFLVRNPDVWQPVASDFFTKCLVPNDDATVLVVDLIKAFARFLTVSSLDRRLSHVSHQDLRNFCDELENVKPKTCLITEPFKDVLKGLGMTPRNVTYASNTNRVGYLEGCGIKGYFLCCGKDVVGRKWCSYKSRSSEEAAAGGEDTRVALPVAWQRLGLTERPEAPDSSAVVAPFSAAAVAPFSAEAVVPAGAAAVVPDGAAGVAPAPDVEPKFWGVSPAGAGHVSRPYRASYCNASDKVVQIGRFATAEEAALAVNAAIEALPLEVRIRRHLNKVVDGKPVPKSSDSYKTKGYAPVQHRKPRKGKAKAPVKKPTVTKAAAKKKASSSRRASECWDNTDDRHWVTGVGWKSGPKPVTEPSSRAGRRAARRADSDSN